MTRQALDVSELPSFAFHHRGTIFWGTMGMIAIEGMTFALIMMAYLYLKGREPHWPPGHFSPELLWGTLNTIVLVLSTVPNQLTKKAAERMDLRKVQLWMAVALVFAVAFNIIRIFEFRSLNVWWDDNAYGSVVWLMLGFHTFHVLTDLVDSSVLFGVVVFGPMKESHFVDVADNSLYWYFVVISWIPVYALIYLAPRLS